MYYEFYTDPERSKLITSQAKLGRQVIKLGRKVRKKEKEIDKIEGIAEELKEKEKELNEIIDRWEEKKAKTIKIGDVIPEEFDGEVAEKQAKELPGIFEEMDGNVKHISNLVEGIHSQVLKINSHKTDLQIQVNYLKRQIDSKDSEIKSIARQLLNM